MRKSIPGRLPPCLLQVAFVPGASGMVRQAELNGRYQFETMCLGTGLWCLFYLSGRFFGLVFCLLSKRSSREETLQ